MSRRPTFAALGTQGLTRRGSQTRFQSIRMPASPRRSASTRARGSWAAAFTAPARGARCSQPTPRGGRAAGEHVSRLTVAEPAVGGFWHGRGREGKRAHDDARERGEGLARGVGALGDDAAMGDDRDRELGDGPGASNSPGGAQACRRCRGRSLARLPCVEGQPPRPLADLGGSRVLRCWATRWRPRRPSTWTWAATPTGGAPLLSPLDLGDDYFFFLNGLIPASANTDSSPRPASLTASLTGAVLRFRAGTRGEAAPLCSVR